MQQIYPKRPVSGRAILPGEAPQFRLVSGVPMSRRRRIHVSGGFYHVTLRGNHRQAIFRDAADRSALDAIVRGAGDRTGTKVVAYCWMGNHIHLVVQVAERALGQFMQVVGSRYARYLQRQTGTTGHLFERRYHAVVVRDDRQLLDVVRYVHLNPVRAGLVASPADYKWSSHRCYLGVVDVPWIHPQAVLAPLGSGVAEVRQVFAGFCGEAVRAPECMAATRELLARQVPVDQCHGERRRPDHHTFDQIVAGVCNRANVPEHRLAAPGKSHVLSALRAEIAVRTVDAGAASLTEVARRFNRDLSSVARAATRWRQTRGSGNCQMPNPVPLEGFT